MLKAMGQVFYTELLCLFRSSQEWLAALMFFIIVISLFPLALDPDPVFLQKYVPGGIWIAALLSSLLSIENVFFTDIENGHCEQLCLSEVPFTLLILSKLSAQWLITQLPLLLLTPLIGIGLQLSRLVIFALSMSLLLGTPTLTLVGSLGAALTVGLRQQGALLGLLIMPLALPVLIFGVMITQQAQAALPMASSLAFLAGIALLALALLPWAIATTLRISMDE